MTTSRREFLKVAGAAAAAGAVARPTLSRAQARKGVPPDPVKVGVLAIRAGIAAPVGTAGLRGTEWWTERVNKSGGILGARGQSVVEQHPPPKQTLYPSGSVSHQNKLRGVQGGLSLGVIRALDPISERLGA